MKLPDGLTIYVGSKKFKSEIPDNMVPKGVKKKLEKAGKPTANVAADKDK